MNPIACSSACTVTVVLSPTVAGSDEYAAINTLYAVILLAAVSIWGLKQLRNLFFKPTDA